MSVPTEATCQVCTERVTGEQIAYYNPKKWVVICYRCMGNHPALKTAIWRNQQIEGATWK